MRCSWQFHGPIHLGVEATAEGGKADPVCGEGGRQPGHEAEAGRSENWIALAAEEGHAALQPKAAIVNDAAEAAAAGAHGGGGSGGNRALFRPRLRARSGRRRWRLEEATRWRCEGRERVVNVAHAPPGQRRQPPLHP